MPEYDVSQGAGKVPCDTNEGLELGGGNVDRFDEMATNAVACAACKLGIRHKAEMCVVQRVAAALRETDAKAREEERERCAGIAKAYMHIPPFDESTREGIAAAYSNGTCKRIAAAIREGADACGTCGGDGRIVPHFDAPEDDCPNAQSVGVPGMDDLRSCGCEEVPCPACQGGDDA